MQTKIHKLALNYWILSLGLIGAWTAPDSTQSTTASPGASSDEAASGQLPKGFVYLADVDPTIQQDVRYAGKHNFVGRPIVGYERATVILTAKAAQALAAVQATLQKDSQGAWSLKVYDGYRPQRAVEDFWRWSQDLDDLAMHDEFYPDIVNKEELFKQGYVDRQSGHSRGSTVDVTIVVINKDPQSAQSGQEQASPDNSLDMGSPFDLFDPISHYASEKISAQARKNRKCLRDLMVAHGFVPYEKEWWHFTLQEEPFPDTYFDFPVR